jgi:hypothetical protein
MTDVGLTGHLKTHFKPMYQLYKYLKAKDDLLTEDEIAMVSGKNDAAPETISTYLTKLGRDSNTLLKAFVMQNLKLEVCINIE